MYFYRRKKPIYLTSETRDKRTAIKIQDPGCESNTLLRSQHVMRHPAPCPLSALAPRTRVGVWGRAAHRSFQPLGLTQRLPARVGSGQRGGTRALGDFPRRNPAREQRCHQKRFSDPFSERLEAPGTRAAVILLKRAKRKDRPIPLAAAQDP